MFSPTRRRAPESDPAHHIRRLTASSDGVLSDEEWSAGELEEDEEDNDDKESSSSSEVSSDASDLK